MARNTPSIIEWGTPPEPKPTGWDAVAAQLAERPGQWASVGTLGVTAAKRLCRDRFTVDAGFQHRLVPVEGETAKVVLWLRHGIAPTTGRKATATAS